jgi:ABC-type Mn2+/Zn2+ transport system ATPase subunit
VNAFLEIRDFTMARGGSKILAWTGNGRDGERSSPSSPLAPAAPAAPIEVPRNRVTALIGANGSGKTSFLEACLGLLPYSGTLRVLGEIPPHANARIGYVSQSADRYRSEFLRARDLLTIDLAIGRFNHGRNLSDFLDRYALAFDFDLNRRMSELSLGQVQKVAIARALLDQPEALFLDEPFSGLDRRSQEEILATLAQVKRLFSPDPSLTAGADSDSAATPMPSSAADSDSVPSPAAAARASTPPPPANFNILIVTHDLHNLASLVDSALLFENFGVTYLSDLTDQDLHGEGHHA